MASNTMDGNQLNQRYASGDRSFQNLDLSGAELSGLDLREADFGGSDLYGAKLMDSLLNRVNFSDRTNLAYADLSGADLTEANLSGANLEGANLEGAITQGAIYNHSTNFPVSFSPEAAGMIRAEDRDRQSRIAQTESLKAQPTSIPLQDLVSALEIESQTAKESSTSPGNLETTAASNNDSSSLDSAAVQANRPKNSACSCVSCSCMAPIVLISLALGTIIFGLRFFDPLLNFQQAANPFKSVQYPRSACGDPLPRDRKKFPVKIYPVFVNYSSANFAKISKQYCRDAFQTRRKDSGILVIQVASFNSQARAKQFAEFMTQKVGSSFTGSPTQIYQ
jgi:Pentapeptide repeats (8 copies)